MDENLRADDNEPLEQTVAIVTAYVTKNSVPVAGLPDLIGSVHAALTDLKHGTAQPHTEPLQPPVSVKKSVTPAYLISMEDGRHYKALKRHLTGLGMTPAEYRQKWNLPKDYPMVARDYAETRSQLAKAAGLGRKVAGSATATETETKPQGGGRPKKAS